MANEKLENSNTCSVAFPGLAGSNSLRGGPDTVLHQAIIPHRFKALHPARDLAFQNQKQAKDTTADVDTITRPILADPTMGRPARFVVAKR